MRERRDGPARRVPVPPPDSRGTGSSRVKCQEYGTPGHTGVDREQGSEPVKDTGPYSRIPPGRREGPREIWCDPGTGRRRKDRPARGSCPDQSHGMNWFDALPIWACILNPAGGAGQGLNRGTVSLNARETSPVHQRWYSPPVPGRVPGRTFSCTSLPPGSAHPARIITCPRETLN